MKVLVTGATGFTGSYTVPALLKKGYRVRCFVRKTSTIDDLSARLVDMVVGDLNDMDSFRQALDGMDALVNVASIGFGHAPGIVQAVCDARIKRAVFISTTAIYTNLEADSKKTRIEAERAIIESGLDYTIIRPTMIYGSSRDRNICRLIRFLKKYPAIPVFGNGTFLQQPIYVKDLADAIVKVVSTEKTHRRNYNIAGAQPLTFNQIIETISTLLGRKTLRLNLPVGPVVNTLRFFEKCAVRFPISSEQVLRLNEDKAFDYTAATRDFGFSPLDFSEGVSREIKEMGLFSE